MAYSATTWINKVTTLGPTNLNKLEQGVANAAAVADSAMSAGSGAIPSTQKGAANGVSTLDAGTKVPVAQLPAGVANGVASLDANGHVPGAQRGYYGATPPANPQTGDIWLLPADAAAGVVWTFRYNAASASAYKWEFVGGAEASVIVDALAVVSNTAWNDLGLAVTASRAGDYLVSYGIGWYLSSGASAQALIREQVGATAPGAADETAIVAVLTTVNQHMPNAARTVLVTAAAGDTIKLVHRLGSAGSGVALRLRWLTVRPRRVI